MIEEFDYRKYYNEIASIVAPRFPYPCEICTADMVRMLVYENDTLRIALNLPLPSKVRSATEHESND